MLLRSATERLVASGSETARLDAEVLLAHVLGVERTTVLAHPAVTPGPAAGAAFREAIDRRAAGEPVAYIRGFKEFYGLVVVTDARALIPRPETERLVELAFDAIRERLVGAPRPPGAPPLRVHDVGTGSGAVAVALAVLARRRGFAEHVRILASDRSAEALELAIQNVVGHGTADLIELRPGDLLAIDPPPDAVPAPWDLVVANLPYVASAEVPRLPVAASFEPRAALDGGSDGLDQVRRLLAALPDGLADGGGALLEIGSDQEGAARGAAAAALAGWPVRVHADLAGHPRVLEVRRP
jgi:release factor glutamine methyltransferase